MERGTWGFSERMEYYRNKPVSDLVLSQDSLAESQTATFINYLMINYGLTDQITIGGTLPYLGNYGFRAAITDDELSRPGISNLGNSAGLADANFYALCNILDGNKYPVSTAFLWGLNVPTGKTNARDNNGQLFTISDQAGSGAWSPFAGIIVTKEWDKLLLSTNLIYTQTTAGANNSTIGSFLDYNLAAVYEFYKDKNSKLSLDGVLELNGETGAKNKTDGILDSYSGGRGIFWLSGLRMNIASEVSLYLAVSLPLQEQYNGVQVTTKYNAIAGIDISI